MVGIHVISTDVLCYAPGLARRHVGLADVIEQGGLAVVDVTHHRHHRGARLRGTFVLRQGFLELVLQLVGADQLDFMSHLLDHQGRGVLVDHLVDGRHHTQLHQLLNDLTGLHRHRLGESTDRNHVGHLNFVDLLLGRHLKTVLAVFLVGRLGLLAATTSTGNTRLRCLEVGQ